MITILLITLLVIMIPVIIGLDLIKKISLTSKYILGIYLIIAPHFLLIFYLFNEWTKRSNVHGIIRYSMFFVLSIITLYIWIRINVCPDLNNKSGNMRLAIMIAGRSIMFFGLYTFFVQIIVVPLFYLYISNIPKNIIIIDSIITILNICVLIYNGALRMFCTSKRLGIIKRVLILCTCWIPIINIIVILYVCNIIWLEYDHESYKVVNLSDRVKSQVCATKYPLLLVHGLGFRDLKYLNYWGRIPKELIKNGSRIYYGHQEAWGSIEENAGYIKEKVFEILKENNCEKVNILAHSKGGLDTRYMISKLEMADYVASVTTISTPHRGSCLLDVLCKMPDGLYKKICNKIDRYFKKIGDKNPNAYIASRQLCPAYAAKFNKDVKDAPNIYYQSFTSIMGNSLSHLLLTIPYLLMKPIDSENDGLVGVESAKWGNFRGVICNKHFRGISHADIIDLKREDYKGFDVIETYVQIVSELKKMGY